MSTSPFLVTVRGIPNNPVINVRTGPNTTYTKLLELPVGTANLPVLEVRADDQNTQIQGRLYQWLRCTLPNGQVGWVRDDLVTVQGDGTRFGYPVVTQATLAGSLTRTTPPPAGISTPPTPVTPPRRALSSQRQPHPSRHPHQHQRCPLLPRRPLCRSRPTSARWIGYAAPLLP